MGNTPLRIIQISDIHLLGDPEKALLGVKTQESFQAVIDLLHQHAEKADLILLSGDLSQDGSEGTYTRIAGMLKDFNLPVYCIPGNHDDARVMAKIYPYEMISNHRHIILKNWHLILLNSQVPGSVHGFLDQSQLSYLQHCLHAYPEHNAIIVFHHQPLPVGSAWLDKLGLRNADEFWEVIKGYPKVSTVLFGHVHQEFVGKKNNVTCYSPPSTCIQFMRKRDDFALEDLPPGYRWVELYDDGSLKTGITRVNQYIGVFDKNAKGY